MSGLWFVGVRFVTLNRPPNTLCAVRFIDQWCDPPKSYRMRGAPTFIIVEVASIDHQQPQAFDVAGRDRPGG